MTLFLAGLLLKIALTAGITVAASIVVERSGPFIGSLIASLPTAGGAALIILAWEHPPAFIAQSAVGSMVANALVAVFALSYAALAQRHGLALSLGSAFGVWFAVAGLTRLVEWDAARAALLIAVVFPLTIVAGARFRSEGLVRRVKLTARELAWRTGVVTLCVIVVTAASHSIGSFASGLFAFFPVAMASFFVILHPRLGGPAAASVAAHVQAPLIGLGLGMLAVHFLAEPIGVWWSYAVGLSIGICWNAMLWVGRNRLRRRTSALTSR
jgi:energy-converting hydrogenase Eha subunit E